ncbi:hypothetical protein NM688_g3650 [Phlebia brevispora]|uniref:Uncharacterized protein n=1 Tax=Phlebia brevispora TaxID=194682 RepID=A0ACC1T516_9APHY|nr:hypothetical protein NM688_g3650 [Phlebia brevispora]
MTLKLCTPTEFAAFPFLPYEIQLQLMQHLYAAIEDKKVAIVESPTGTGKTLSLLCASLTWLRDEQERARRGKLLPEESNDEHDWVVAQTIERKRRQLEAEEVAYAERLAQARQKEEIMRRAARARVRKKLKPNHEDPVVNVDLDDIAFLPDNVDSSAHEGDNISPAVRALMQKLERSKGTAPVAEEEPTCTKIYYASRTHSQLSQVLHELRKVVLSLSPSSVTSLHDSRHSASKEPDLHNNLKRSYSNLDNDEDTYHVDIRSVSLGSRRQLCINDKLKAKVFDIDEACRQMLSAKGDKRCTYLPPVDDELRMLDFRDQVLAVPKDIEELVEVGESSHICPYFGSRRAIAQAQVKEDPLKAARESLGIDLTNQVIIIDEAHNLISTLLSLSAVHLPLQTLSTSLTQLGIYVQKFRNRLSTEHLLHLKRLLSLLEALQKYAEEWKVSHGEARGSQGRRDHPAEMMTSGELLRRLGRKVEGVNLLEVEKYLRNSKVGSMNRAQDIWILHEGDGEDCRRRHVTSPDSRLMLYLLIYLNAVIDPKKRAKLARISAMTPPLHVVESFIIALTAASDDGRVTLSMEDGQLHVKYQHLNPATYFREVVETARSVILAGGTMSPISDVVNQLFTSLPQEKLTTFSCGHIIPSSNLQAIVVRKGPRGSELQFKYEQRSDPALIAELGQMIFNFANVVPDGMVVFVPSYSFLHSVTAVWESNKLLDRLKVKKKLFMEPKNTSEVDAVLHDYAAAIEQKHGALLFAVVGAKLSEGLNFSDELARAVVIIGLPFANLASPELRERMNYVKRLEEQRTESKSTGTRDAGTELYENMCMNAVNQSIGRAIRHRGDWASLVLVDSRYGTPRIRNKLPKWIGKDVLVSETFGETMRELGRFYREKRSAASQ